MRAIAFLRAVMPTGPNRIPKMAVLAGLLTEAGYRNVRTYIQSGNILLDTDRGTAETAEEIHCLIRERIGADLHVIVKPADALRRALEESPFGQTADGSCVFFVFSNDRAAEEKLQALRDADWGAEQVFVGAQCIHLWLPWDARPRRLSNTYLEKRLGVLSTMRNRNVVEKLCELAQTAEAQREAL